MTATPRRIITTAGVLVVVVFLPLVPAVGAAELGKAPDLPAANWIWPDEGGPGKTGPLGYFRRKFVLPAEPVEATIALTADNGYELYVNDRRVAGKLGYDSRYWSSVERLRIEQYLHEGANAIAVKAECLGGSAGLVAAVYVRTADGGETSFVTDDLWLSTAKPDGNWTEPDHDDSLWRPAVLLTKMGGRPWGPLPVPDRLTDPKRLVIDRSAPGRFVPQKADTFTEPGDGFLWPAGVVFVGGRAALHSTQAQRAKWEVQGSQASFEYDTPAPSASGHRLYALVPAAAGVARRLLLDAGSGLIASPTCSYDGREIIFAMVPEEEKFFKLFRIGVDGSGLERLTTGPWQDYDPAVLPDGRIVFASSRIGSRDEYHGNTARSLFCLSADRTTVHPLTYHIVADSEPAVMADGRVAFVRHDNFMERAKVETRIHSVHPDGTAGQTLIGPDRGKITYDRPTGAEHAYSWLRNFGFGSPAPLAASSEGGQGRVACLSSHGPLITSVLLRDQVQQERMPSDVALFDISPLPDGRLLCSTIRGALGILDPDSGDVVKLLETDTRDLHSVAYLGPQRKPRMMAPKVTAEAERRHDKSGYLLCQRIFGSQQLDGDWQRVKAVRVIQGKPFTLRSAHHQYCHIGVEGIELGTAPLAPDGSFFVRVPADRALALQAIDAEGRPVVNEMSWIYVRPGERRSCTGCHNRRQATPHFGSATALAALARPVDLRPTATAHRFRANNAANGGVLNLQFDRFREAASINLYAEPVFPPGMDPTGLPPGRRSEVEKLVRALAEGRPNEKVAAARRLAIFRDRRAVPALAGALGDDSESVRCAAGLALAPCGNRPAVPALLRALGDPSPHVAQAANVALEHLTGHAEEFNPYGDRTLHANHAAAWRRWFETHDWTTIESDLLVRVDSQHPVVSHRAIEALGHVGSAPGKAALRRFLESGRDDSLVARLAAIRALGHLGDESAVALLARILEENIAKTPVKPQKSHEFGWAAPPDHLAGAAAEALGWIATPEAEDRLIAACGKLVEFWYYTFRTADHSWLMGCHSSIPHYRIVEALDAVGSRKAAGLTGKLLEAVPMDPDRGLLYENDAYETVTARVIQRNGMGHPVVEACLAVLGDAEAEGSPELIKAVTASPPAVSVGVLSAESRAAHLLSVVCLRPEDAPRVRAAFERYRAEQPSRKRSWTCFFLARTLGKLRDRGSVDALRAALDDEPAEASFGIPDPPNVFIHQAMTPVHRAAAADALGRIGAKQAVPSLLAAVAEFDNAMEVRQAAADALRRIADPASLPQLESLARHYPEIATQQTLREACAAARSR
jgi:HEAT repeat protein